MNKAPMVSGKRRKGFFLFDNETNARLNRYTKVKAKRRAQRKARRAHLQRTRRQG